MIERAAFYLPLAATLAACRTAPVQHHVEIETPPVISADPPVVSAPAPKVALPQVARMDSKSEAVWARAFKAEKAFRRVVAPNASAVTFVWRIGPQRKLKDLPSDQDYPGNYVESVELAFGAGETAASIALGELAGYAEPFDVTYCRGRGFRLPSNETWNFPSEPSVASAFSLGIAQGSSDFLLVRDGDELHLLHRESNDGRCDDVKQGPLQSCEGQLYERAAEIRVPHGATLYERIDDDGKPLDCGAAHYGRSLLPPP